MVKILTSQHSEDSGRNVPILFSELEFEQVVLEDGCDIGIGAVILPGATVGEGAIIGGEAVVKDQVPTYEIWAGVPARKIGIRE